MKKTLLQPQHLLLLFFLLISFCATSCKEDFDEDTKKSEAYYQGEVRIAHLSRKTAPGLYNCYFTNRKDFSELVVAAIVYSEDGDIVFIPKTPIRTGGYYFNRAVAITTDKKEDEELIGQDLALGCQIDFTARSFSVKNGPVDPLIGCYGSGTEADPYIISSYAHLDNLQAVINSPDQNRNYRDKYYSQTDNISLGIPCANVGGGWNSIGNGISTPFAGHYNGNGKNIKDMLVKRIGNSVPQPSGLFGVIVNSTISNVNLTKSEINSDFPVAGMLVGSIVSTGKDMLTSSISNCSVSSSCKIRAPYLTGGLVGGVNQFARLIMVGCDNKMPISCDKPGVGGLIGAAFLTSSVTIDKSSNSGMITGNSGIVGGLVGSADTLLINNCTNTGAITGGKSSIGTGGLVGGGTNVVASYCTNNGKVVGGREVGGIMGSAARNSSEKIYGDAHFYTSANKGQVEGVSEVGGLVGSAQILISGCYNFNSVSATSKNVGGLAGLGPMAVIVNSTNDGNVSCSGGSDDNFVGGVLGSAQDYSITACNNFGTVSISGEGTVGGIIGGCDMLGTLSYCGNYGAVTGAGGSVGGIIGRAGKPKNMTDKMIADMVLGTVFSVASVGLSGLGIVSDIAGAFVNMTKVSLSLNITGKILNTFTTINDVVWTSINNTTKGSTLTKSELENLQVQRNEQLINDHKSKISTMEWGGYSTFAKKQQEVQDLLVVRLSQDMSTYDKNVNKWRNDVEGKMKAAEKSREVAGHVGESISFAGDILGFCPIPNPVSILVTAVVTLYNLVMNLTDYSYNRVGLIQCFNYGAVTASSGRYGGGIAGELHDYARIYNSANYGKISGGKHGALIGLGGHLPEITHSVNFDKKDNDSAQDLYYSCPFWEEIKYNVNNGKQNAWSRKSYEKEGFDLENSWFWWEEQSVPIINKSQFE